ncbi:hypothetical protein PBAL39_25290 [Pedobacter sp. BAL39]|nr:hypothetical protein PBAL39_25290 [Pedobacter sp. BAL39]
MQLSRPKVANPANMRFVFIIVLFIIFFIPDLIFQVLYFRLSCQCLFEMIYPFSAFPFKEQAIILTRCIYSLTGATI